jgi:hypothetical protein
MSEPTLDQRVAILEQEVALLSKLIPYQNGDNKNWRSSLGMFADDPVIKEIIAEGKAIRELDRQQVGE